MRIIAGKYRGRHFDVPRTFKARPTTDFAKENLFNVLRSYIDFEGNAPCALDLFAGTGSITLELLSRGCSHVTSVELDPQHVSFIRRFLQALRAEDDCTLLRADVLRFLRRASGSYDFIFADPPYTLPSLTQLPGLVFGEDLTPSATPSEKSDEDSSSAGLASLEEANPFEAVIPHSSVVNPHSSLLNPGGLFVLEHGKTQDFSLHPHFVAHRAYGSVNFSLFQ